MDKVPQGWTICQLEECVDILDNQRVPINHQERQKRLGIIPYYGATGQVGWINDYLFDTELLLVGEDGSPFFDKTKSIAYLIEGKSWVNNHAHVLKANTKITTNLFLKNYLNQFNFQGYITGTTRLKLNQSSLKIIPILLPPLNEQRRIVAKLEKLLAKVDACKQRLEKIPTILARFRQSVLAAACSGRLTADWREQNPDIEPASELIGSLNTPFPENYFDIFKESSNYEIPDKWEFIPLGKLGKLTGGGTPSKSNPEFWNGAIPWISAKDMKQDRLSNSIDHITEIALEHSSVKIIPKSSIIFVVRGMILIHTFPVAITEDVVTINQDVKALIPERVEMSEYIFIVIKSIAKNILFSTKEATHGTRRIETPILKNWAIPIPPFAEQQEIVNRVEVLFQKADRIEQRYQKAKAHIDQLTQSILAKAFRGELVPRDPNDEPASVLLDRIREERAKQPKAKNAKKSTEKTPKVTGKRGGKKAHPPEPPESDNSEPIQLKLPGIE